MGALRAEWGKVWGLRATVLCLLAIAPFGLVVSFTLGNDAAHDVAIGALTAGTLPDPVGPASTATQLALLVFAAAAMLLVTSEYQGRTMSATLLAQPRRGVVIVAKAVIAGVLGAMVGFVTGAVAWVLAAVALGASFDILGALGCGLRGAGLFAVAGPLVVGLGFLLRRSVGALVAAAVLLLAALALPEAASRWTPAGGAAAFLSGEGSGYQPGIGLAVVGVWALLALASAGLVFRRRDA